MNSEQHLYEGKAKIIYPGPQAQQLRVLFKDSLTAFNALKKGSFAGKGSLNRDIASLLFRQLHKSGVASHWIADQGPMEMIVHAVQIIPLEVVVRNTLAGSTAKKLGISEGKVLNKPLLEFYLKNDDLADPFLSDDQVYLLELATPDEVSVIKTQALKINALLKDIFAQIDINLVDFKIEFGRLPNGQILLADEITPDCCRLWDMKSGEKLDKDRFRRDLGNVQESYEQVLQRLQARFA